MRGSTDAPVTTGRRDPAGVPGTTDDAGRTDGQPSDRSDGPERGGSAAGSDASGGGGSPARANGSDGAGPAAAASTASPVRSSDPIEVCLLAPGGTLSTWAWTAVEHMLAETRAEIRLVIEDTSSDERSLVDAARRAVELREWGVVAAAMAVLGDDLAPLERRPVRNLPGLDGAEWIRADPVAVDGWKNRIPAPAVRRMAESDVAIRFGFGFLVGDALTAPEHGVVSFHHGDVREYRGQPMGFWEFVHGRVSAGVTLQRINETLDGGEIVTQRRVDIGDAPTWGAVRERLFETSEDMLSEGVRRLADEAFEPETVAEDDLGDLYTLPRGRPVLTYVGKTARGTLLG